MAEYDDRTTRTTTTTTGRDPSDQTRTATYVDRPVQDDDRGAQRHRRRPWATRTSSTGWR